MLSARLFVAQRVSALVMAPLAIAHLLGIAYAIGGGLDAAEILARTRGSWWLGAGYQLFVLAAAVHGAIGIRVIGYEWMRLRGRALDALAWLIGAALLALGSLAVYAVVLG